jgi:hypothetical protein
MLITGGYDNLVKVGRVAAKWCFVLWLAELSVHHASSQP